MRGNAEYNPSWTLEAGRREFGRGGAAAAPNPNPSRHPPYHITVMPPADDPRLRHISDSIRSIPNWPKEGILFQDITTTLLDPVAFEILHSKSHDQRRFSRYIRKSNITNLRWKWQPPTNLVEFASNTVERWPRHSPRSLGSVRLSSSLCWGGGNETLARGNVSKRRERKKNRVNFLWDAGLGGWRTKRETKDGGGSASQAWDRIMKSDESWLQSLSLDSTSL